MSRRCDAGLGDEGLGERVMLPTEGRLLHGDELTYLGHTTKPGKVMVAGKPSDQSAGTYE